MTTKAIHEPEEALMDVHEVWEDFLRLKEYEVGQDFRTVAIDEQTDRLIQEIVDRGICRDATEVIVRAVRGFFAAIWPPAPEKTDK
ncbi:MAG TPA: hypothetical protein VM163_00040 [bacterium]|nr:hypothetical protein [bacterium]